MNIKALLAVMGIGFGGTVLALAGSKPDTVSNAAAADAAKKTPEQIADKTAPEAEAATSVPKKSDSVKETKDKGTIIWNDRPEKASKPTDTKVDAKNALLTDKQADKQTEKTGGVSRAQLDALLAPIALYPDQLLQQILMASTYPLEVVEAARWAARPENENLKGDALSAALEDQEWDPSVKALVAFPQILKMLDSDLNWLGNLGDAFLAQQTEVMDSVQRLRREARDADKLNSDVRRQVVMEDDQIVIQPANPEVVYVPFYNPSDAYGVWPYPETPPVYIPPPVGYVYTPGIYYSYVSVNHYWSWSRWDWRQRRIRIVDPPRHVHSNPGRRWDDDVWRHNPDRGHGRGRGDWDREGDRNRDRWPPRPAQPDVVTGKPGPGGPIVIHDGNVPRTSPPIPPGARDWRDAPAAQRIAPRDRVHQPQPGALPDLSPPLPATAVLPATPPVANPAIGVQQPLQNLNQNQNNDFRRRWDNDDRRRTQETRDNEDFRRRQQQFQEGSITAPPLTNTPAVEQQPPIAQPPQYRRAMPALESTPAPIPAPPTRPVYQQPPAYQPPPMPVVQPIAPIAPPVMQRPAPVAMPQPLPQAMPQPAPQAQPQPQPAPQAAPQMQAPAQPASDPRFGNRGQQQMPSARQPGCGPYGCPRQ